MTRRGLALGLVTTAGIACLAGAYPRERDRRTANRRGR